MRAASTGAPGTVRVVQRPCAPRCRYMNMAGQLGGIDPLLDGFFGFLRRKTDFFTGAVSPEAAQASVLAAFTKNMERSEEDAREKAAKEKKRKADEEARRERLQADKAKQQKAEEEESRIVDVTDEAEEAPPSASAAAAPEKEGEKEGEEGQEESKGQVPINNGGTCDTYRWEGNNAGLGRKRSRLEYRLQSSPGVGGGRRRGLGHARHLRSSLCNAHTPSTSDIRTPDWNSQVNRNPPHDP